MSDETLLELLRRRVSILLNADEEFIRSVKSVERSIWRTLLRVLDSLTIRLGRIIKDESSTALLINLRRTIRETIRRSELSTAVSDFLPRFDQVENLQGATYGRLRSNPAFKLPNTAVAKRLATEQVVASIGELRGLESSYMRPLINRMFTLVETQAKASEAREILRQYIVGETASGGALAKYSRQVTMDLLNGYDGFIQKKLLDEYGYDGWFYLGSIIKDSRPNCVNLINGTGWFEDLAIRPGLYATADIPIVVERASMVSHRSGWRPETTAESFPIHRCGYNCRHSLLFTDLTDSESQRRLARIAKELSKEESVLIV